VGCKKARSLKSKWMQMSKVESKRGRLELLLKTNVKGTNNPTTFGHVEKTSSKTMVIIDPKTKAKKAHVYKFLE